MEIKSIIFSVIFSFAVTASELFLAGWLGRREEIFTLKKKNAIFLFVFGNLVLLLFSLYQESSGGYRAAWYFGLWTYLFGMGIYDLKCRELPDWWHLFPFLSYGLAWVFGYQPVAFGSSLFSCVGLAAVLGLIYLIRKDAIGLGDIKLILFCALYLGQACVGMLVRGMTAAFVCSIILLLCKKVTPKSGLPFVPFLLLGALFI